MTDTIAARQSEEESMVLDANNNDDYIDASTDVDNDTSDDNNEATMMLLPPPLTRVLILKDAPAQDEVVLDEVTAMPACVPYTSRRWKRQRGSAADRERRADAFYCANCGGRGHVYRICNYPICSFGVICVRIAFDPIRTKVFPEYLMVQRKDSLCYVEFLRAKWSVQNRAYVMKLFASMTPKERERIANARSFDDLWYSFWHNDACKSYMREYEQAQQQFDMLRKGFRLRCADTGDVIHFSLEYILSNTKAQYDDTEWGWPKGRRNIDESDIRCALREFGEETGMNAKGISLLPNVEPFQEVFNGCNNVRYRHVYYLGVQVGPSQAGSELPVKSGSLQEQEIQRVRWCHHNAVLENIREHNTERRELFSRVHEYVVKHLLNIALMAATSA